MSTLALAKLAHAAQAVLVAAAAVGQAAVLACGDGPLRVFCPGDAAPLVIEAHRGATLSVAAERDGRSIMSGGDGGRFLRVHLDGRVEEPASVGRAWVDHVARAATEARLLGGPAGASWGCRRPKAARARPPEHVGLPRLRPPGGAPGRAPLRRRHRVGIQRRGRGPIPAGPAATWA